MTDVITKVSINGQVVPFGGGGSEGQEVVYLTQAEYDALPASKLTDGKIYKIKTSGVAPTPGGESAFDRYSNWEPLMTLGSNQTHTLTDDEISAGAKFFVTIRSNGEVSSIVPLNLIKANLYSLIIPNVDYNASDISYQDGTFTIHSADTVWYLF